MLNLKQPIQIHWDDDFVRDYPALANTIVEYRKQKKAPTELYYEDKLTDRFGFKKKK